MSQEQKIAELLTQMIRDRQNLVIGESVAATMPGSMGAFSTSIGSINAKATNFCYGNCLVAKVDGVWYAVNPAATSEVVRANVDRFIQRKAKIDDPLIYRFIGLNKYFNSNFEVFLLNYHGEDLYVSPDNLSGNIDFNTGEIIFRIFPHLASNPLATTSIESVSAEEGHYQIAYITSDRSKFIKLELGQSSIELTLPSGIDSIKATYGRGFVLMGDRNYYRFANPNFYRLSNGFSGESTAESTAGAIVLWERNNPTVRNQIIALINSNTSIDGWEVGNNIVPRSAIVSHAQIDLELPFDLELPLFKTQLQFDLNGWSVDRSFTFGTRSKQAQVLSSGLINSAVYQNANIFELEYILRELYGVTTRSTILERDELEYNTSKIYLVGVGGIELKVQSTAIGTTFELAGTVEDLWTIDRRTDTVTQEELNTPFWKLYARLKADYTRSLFTIPIETTCTIDNVVIEINNQLVEISSQFNSPSVITGFDIVDAAVFVAEQIETTYRNYNYVDDGTIYPNFALIDGAADYKNQTIIVRRLDANPVFTGLKYLVAIAGDRIYNLQIESQISQVYREFADDPQQTERIFTSPMGCAGQDYGFYPTGLRYTGEYKRSTTAYNFKRDWGAQNPAWKFQYSVSIPNIPPLPDYHPFASPEAIGCQSNNIPTLTVFGITSQTFYNPSSVMGTYAVNCTVPDVPNLHYNRRVTGFNCSIVSSYEITADWITTPRIIMPHPDYFANNSTLMGKNSEGAIELYRSRDSVGSTIPATVEKWIVNAQSRFELIDLFAPEVSDSVVTGSAIATQYYPY